MSLSLILDELLAQAKKEGRAKLRTLKSGLTVAARWEADKPVLTLSRANHPKGPSTQEAHTCAKHAGFGEQYGFKADPEDKTITVWKEPR